MSTKSRIKRLAIIEAVLTMSVVAFGLFTYTLEFEVFSVTMKKTKSISVLMIFVILYVITSLFIVMSFFTLQNQKENEKQITALAEKNYTLTEQIKKLNRKINELNQEKQSLNQNLQDEIKGKDTTHETRVFSVINKSFNYDAMRHFFKEHNYCYPVEFSIVRRLVDLIDASENPTFKSRFTNIENVKSRFVSQIKDFERLLGESYFRGEPNENSLGQALWLKENNREKFEENYNKVNKVADNIWQLYLELLKQYSEEKITVITD